MIITILLAILGVFICFVAAPSAIVCYCLTKRKDPTDFDRDPAKLDDPCYAPWRKDYLDAFAWMRKQPFQEVETTAFDGATLKADWLPLGFDRTVIMVHGYRTTPLNNYAAIGRSFAQEGWNLLIVWQRAHGKSGGKTTTFGLQEQKDALTWARWAQEHIGTPFVMYGISMGAASLGYASSQAFPPAARALVLDCAYCRPYNQMLLTCKTGMKFKSILLPFCLWLFKWVLKTDMKADIRTDLKKATLPVLFISGQADETVEFREMQDAYEACTSEKELLPVPKATHTTAFMEGGKEVQEKVFAFLTKQMTS